MMNLQIKEIDLELTDEPAFKIFQRVKIPHENILPEHWEEYVVNGVRLYLHKWYKEVPSIHVWEYCLIQPGKFGEKWVIEDSLCDASIVHAIDFALQF
ncbi:MAG: hypothetical protein WBF90_33905 [Rivularia sp. (in: cyanobacteria)]